MKHSLSYRKTRFWKSSSYLIEIHYEDWPRILFTKCPFGEIFQKLEKNKSDNRPKNQILNQFLKMLFCQ